MEQIQERANALAPELLRLRRTLHQCPELGFELPQTRAVVTEELERIGCHDVRMYGGGLTAWLGKPGRTLLLRAATGPFPIRPPTPSMRRSICTWPFRSWLATSARPMRRRCSPLGPSRRGRRGT